MVPDEDTEMTIPDHFYIDDVRYEAVEVTYDMPSNDDPEPQNVYATVTYTRVGRNIAIGG